MRSRGVVLALLALALAGCPAEHPQSALHRRSQEAGRIARLWWVARASTAP
ncbi:MAG: hypothetical protein KIT58_08970 [Planctomycetota bacterium]|nr:hypothetical protein [Planctomycetota bacterium]